MMGDLCGQKGFPPAIVDFIPGVQTNHTKIEPSLRGVGEQQGTMVGKENGQEIHILIFKDPAESETQTSEAKPQGKMDGSTMIDGLEKATCINKNGSGANKEISKREAAAQNPSHHRGDTARLRAILSSVKENVRDGQVDKEGNSVSTAWRKQGLKRLSSAEPASTHIGGWPLPCSTVQYTGESPAPLASMENLLEVWQSPVSEGMLHVQMSDMASPERFSRLSYPMATSTPIAKSKAHVIGGLPHSNTCLTQGTNHRPNLAPAHTQPVLLPHNSDFASLGMPCEDLTKAALSANIQKLSAGTLTLSVADSVTVPSLAQSQTAIMSVSESEEVWRPFSEVTLCSSQGPSTSTSEKQSHLRAGSYMEQTPDSGLGLSSEWTGRTPVLEGLESEFGATHASWATSDDSNPMVVDVPVTGHESLDENSNSQEEDSEMNRSLTGMVWLKDYALKKPTTSKSRSPPPPINHRLESRHSGNLCVCSPSDEGEQDQKPAYKYKTLIEMALQSRPDLTMKSCEIRDWLISNFDFFRRHAKCAFWKNAVRHNLSSNDCFVKNKIKKRHWTLRLNMSRRLDGKETRRLCNAGGRGRGSAGGVQPPIMGDPVVLKSLGNQPMMLSTGLPTPIPVVVSSQQGNGSTTTAPATGKVGYQPILPRPPMPSQITLLNVNQLHPSFLCQQPLLVLHIPPPNPPVSQGSTSCNSTLATSVVGMPGPAVLPKLPLPPLEGKRCKPSSSAKSDSRQASGRLRRTRSGGSSSKECNNVLLQAAVQSGLTTVPGHNDEDSFLETVVGDSDFACMDANSGIDAVMDVGQVGGEGQKNLMKRSLSTPAILAKRGKSCAPAAQQDNAASDLAKPKMQSRTRRKQKFSTTESKPSAADVMAVDTEPTFVSSKDFPRPLLFRAATEATAQSSDLSVPVPSPVGYDQTGGVESAGEMQDTPFSSSPQHNSSSSGDGLRSPSSNTSLLLGTSTPLGKVKISLEALPSPIRHEGDPLPHPPQVESTPADSSLMLDDLSAILSQAAPTHASPEVERKPSKPRTPDAAERRRQGSQELPGLSTPPLNCVRNSRSWSLKSMGDHSPALDLGVSHLGSLLDLSDNDLALLTHSPPGCQEAKSVLHHGDNVSMDSQHQVSEQTSCSQSRFYRRLQQVVEDRQGTADPSKPLSKELVFQEPISSQQLAACSTHNCSTQHGMHEKGSDPALPSGSSRDKSLLPSQREEEELLAIDLSRVNRNLPDREKSCDVQHLIPVQAPEMIPLGHSGHRGSTHQGHGSQCLGQSDDVGHGASICDSQSCGTVPQGQQSLSVDLLHSDSGTKPDGRRSCPIDYYNTETSTTAQSTQPFYPQKTEAVPHGRKSCPADFSCLGTDALFGGMQSCPINFSNQEDPSLTQAQQACIANHKQGTITQEARAVPQGRQSYHARFCSRGAHSLHALPQDKQFCHVDVHNQLTFSNAHSIPDEAPRGQHRQIVSETSSTISQERHLGVHSEQFFTSETSEMQCTAGMTMVHDATSSALHQVDPYCSHFLHQGPNDADRLCCSQQVECTRQVVTTALCAEAGEPRLSRASSLPPSTRLSVPAQQCASPQPLIHRPHSDHIPVPHDMMQESLSRPQYFCQPRRSKQQSQPAHLKLTSQLLPQPSHQHMAMTGESSSSQEGGHSQCLHQGWPSDGSCISQYIQPLKLASSSALCQAHSKCTDSCLASSDLTGKPAAQMQTLHSGRPKSCPTLLSLTDCETSPRTPEAAAMLGLQPEECGQALPCSRSSCMPQVSVAAFRPLSSQHCVSSGRLAGQWSPPPPSPRFVRPQFRLPASPHRAQSNVPVSPRFRWHQPFLSQESSQLSDSQLVESSASQTLALYRGVPCPQQQHTAHTQASTHHQSSCPELCDMMTLASRSSNSHTGQLVEVGGGSMQNFRGSKDPEIPSSRNGPGPGQPVHRSMVSTPHQGSLAQAGSEDDRDNLKQDDNCNVDNRHLSMPNFLDMSFEQPSLSDQFCVNYSLPSSKVNVTACPRQNRLQQLQEGSVSGYRTGQSSSVSSASLPQASGFGFDSPQPGPCVPSNRCALAPDGAPASLNEGVATNSGDPVIQSQHADLHQQLSTFHFDSQNSTNPSESCNLSAFFDSLFDSFPPKLS